MSGLALEEYELLEDPKYRAYVASVDKALRNFESTSEWADLISTLGKLNKVLLSHMKYPVVPRRIILSKRLAQCLHPALPSGVHLKALEIYDIIFKCMGTNRLSQELFIYSAGLFPLFSSAAMNVRSALLMIYENHFVPLGTRLRPGLNGFLAGTLSGLEEGSDHLERTSLLLQRVAEGVGQVEFFGCLWECILSNSNVRLPAISHITNSFNRKLSTEDQLHILGTNIDVMVCGLCRALEDSAVLVQRAALDLTLLLLPMHNTQLLRSDLTAIVTSSLMVLLRRDMSLNRRLFAWLLGSEVNLSILTSEHPVMKRLGSSHDGVTEAHSPSSGGESYFQAFSQFLLVDAFINTLKMASRAKEPLDLRPFKIIIPLLDKPEIGPYILDRVFLDLLRCVYYMCESQPSAEIALKENESTYPVNTRLPSHNMSSRGLRSGHDLTKTVLLVFSALQPSYPWCRLLVLLDDCCERSSTASDGLHDKLLLEDDSLSVNEVGCSSVMITEICILLEFLMTVVPLDTQQHLQGARLPEVLSSVTSLLSRSIEALSASEMLAGLQLCKALMEKLIPSMTQSYCCTGGQEDSQDSYSSPQTYPTTYKYSSQMVSEIPSSESTSLDNGIIQIGIEAERELNKKRDIKIVNRSSHLLKETLKGKNQKLGSSSENESVVSSEQVMNDSAATEQYLSADEVADTSTEEEDLQKREPFSRNEEEERPKAVPVEFPSHSCLLSDSFETDLPSHFHNWSQVTRENDLDKIAGSDEIPETSFFYKYIKEFKNLFLLLVEKLLLNPASKTIADLEKLLFSQVSQHSEEKKLSMLMRECLLCSSSNKATDSGQTKISYSGNRQFSDSDYSQLAACITLNPLAADYLQVFRVACTILVELSSMPAAATVPFSSSITAASAKQCLPLWLLGLVACIVAGHQVSASFTQASISTFLELVALAKSDLSIWKFENSVTATPAEGQGVVTLKMLPLLMPGHTHSLLFHTYIFQFMTRELWSHLDISKPECHLVSSDLLLQLHSLSLPQSSIHSYMLQDLSVVEREILRFLTAQRYSPSIKRQPATELLSSSRDGMCWTQSSVNSYCDSSAILRWLTLWQVSRSLSRSVAQSYSYLNRSLFFMVERLQGQSVLERSYSQNWLTESLNYGDLGRILDPIFVFLLHPYTRRVSVQHVNIEKIPQESSKSQQPTSNSSSESTPVESQIYAISSVGGEVMYHIGKGPPVKMKRERHFLSSFKKQIFAFTSLASDSHHKYVTKQINIPDYETPSHSQSNGLPITLMVNPFSRHPWIDMEDLVKMSKTGNSNKTITNAIITTKSKVAWTSSDIAKFVLNEIIDNAVSIHNRQRLERSYDNAGSPHSSTSDSSFGKDLALHPLHSHMLLYTQLVDAGQCLYGLRLIKNILAVQPKLFLLCLASTSVSAQKTSSPLLILLARHRRSIFGEGFDGGNVNDMVAQFRSTMYLQVVITVCLYFIRSYYPQQPHLHVQQEHLRDNRELQVVAAEVLQTVFTQLIPLVVDSPRGFSPYVKDLLNKCKVQKCVLHCLLSAVHIMKESSSEDADVDMQTITQDILEYNFGSSENCQSVPQEQSYIFCLMDLTLSLLKLEDVLLQNKNDLFLHDSLGSFSSKNFSLSSLRYCVGHPIPSQPMFLWAVVIILSQKNLRHFHTSWVTFFTASLPHAGSALPLNSLKIVTLLCALLEELSFYYKAEDRLPVPAPSDYTLHMLSGLMNIVHFCLLDPSQSPVSTQPSSSALAIPPVPQANQTPGQILYNLLHVFSPIGEILDASLDTSTQDPVSCARKTLLSHLPRLISSLLSLWISTSLHLGKQAVILGHRQSVRSQIVELLSPICHHHTPHLLAAVGVVWQGVADEEYLTSSQNSLDRKISSGFMWQYSSHQVSLVEMLAALKVLPLHSLVENVKQVFRNPPVVEGVQQRSPLEVSILQLFYLYVKETASSNQLSVCWGPLLALVREGIMCLPPPALLVLLAVLNEFVQRSPTVQDKKEIKEQQEMAAKLLEAVSTVAGSKLEATNWLRRNLTVKPDSAEDQQKDQNSDVSGYSVAALSVLADLLAPLLDVLYSSEEKERVIPLLTNIMANVIPYLRNHSSGNMPAFHVCSQLLSSLSSYQYTLKAWRKDVLELLLDSYTFRMLPDTLPYWRTLIDNLCTHDKTVFKELLSRISMSQGASLNLFTSKEAEYEIRAGLLKRLAFTIFCSETDQYLKLIPDIQERLTEVTRLGQVVPVLVAQVFLCFRVLLLRVSPRGTTSLWPIVITELVQVLLMMEQELSTDSEQFSGNKKNSSYHLKRMSTLDSKWVVSAHNGLHAHNNPAWLSLYLAACKLLDLMVALPANHLPQFQMYRWAFVGPENSSSADVEREKKPEGVVGSYLLQSYEFVPHVARIAKLMNQKRSKMKMPPLAPPKYSYTLGQPLLASDTNISTLMDLHPFFTTLTSFSHLVTVLSTSESPPTSPSTAAFTLVSRMTEADLSHIEKTVERDFLEPVLGCN